LVYLAVTAWARDHAVPRLRNARCQAECRILLDTYPMIWGGFMALSFTVFPLKASYFPQPFSYPFLILFYCFSSCTVEGYQKDLA
jgi:hypothetical protein